MEGNLKCQEAKVRMEWQKQTNKNETKSKNKTKQYKTPMKPKPKRKSKCNLNVGHIKLFAMLRILNFAFTGDRKPSERILQKNVKIQFFPSVRSLWVFVVRGGQV